MSQAQRIQPIPERLEQRRPERLGPMASAQPEASLIDEQGIMGGLRAGVMLVHSEFPTPRPIL